MENLKFDQQGLIPAIAYEANSGQVLMLAYMNAESLALTLKTGYAHYFSRSRQSLWKKGETSGNVQKIKEIRVDCDGDALLLIIDQTGPACHTGAKSCFFRRMDDQGALHPVGDSSTIAQGMNLEYSIVKERAENPVEGSYTNYLLDKGLDKILKKVGEESTEVVIAAKNRSKEEVTYETADLIYHLSVLLYEQGLTWDEIGAEIVKRRK